MTTTTSRLTLLDLDLDVTFRFDGISLQRVKIACRTCGEANRVSGDTWRGAMRVARGKRAWSPVGVAAKSLAPDCDRTTHLIAEKKF